MHLNRRKIPLICDVHEKKKKRERKTKLKGREEKRKRNERLDNLDEELATEALPSVWVWLIFCFESSMFVLLVIPLGGARELDSSDVWKSDGPRSRREREGCCVGRGSFQGW